jgi:tRNA pseudouridine55 synthase
MAKRRGEATTHGVCVVDKPAGVTSHDVVGMLRRRFHERQVGHAGTLDPDATGVLVVAVGDGDTPAEIRREDRQALHG